MPIPRRSARVILSAALLVIAAGAVASDCTRTSTGLIPITQLGAGLYLNQFPGGLYPGGQNTVPAAHASIGLARAGQIVPLDAGGAPSAAGKVVLLSLGLSNTTQEFCGGAFPSCESFSFIGQAAASPAVNHSTLAIVDGAAGGQTPDTWDMPTDANYDRVRDARLAPVGLTEAQVQAVWIKEAQAMPGVHLPSANADAYTLERGIGNMIRAAKVRYPNLRIVYLSSRIYGGYATSGLNPEPYAYESAFAVKWLIQAQIAQENTGVVDPVAGDLSAAAAPWLVWGAYLWADGLTPRADGLTWECADFNPTDGTHPATGARTKVGTMLLNDLLASPYAAPWFRAGGPVCAADFNRDGIIDPADVAGFVNAWFASLRSSTLDGDFDHNGRVEPADVAAFVVAWFNALQNGC